MKEEIFYTKEDEEEEIYSKDDAIYTKGNYLNKLNVTLAILLGIGLGYFASIEPAFVLIMLIMAIPWGIFILFFALFFAIIYASEPITSPSDIPTTSSLYGCTDMERLKNVKILNPKKFKTIFKNLGVWYLIYIIVFVLNIIFLTIKYR